MILTGLCVWKKTSETAAETVRSFLMKANSPMVIFRHRNANAAAKYTMTAFPTHVMDSLYALTAVQTALLPAKHRKKPYTANAKTAPMPAKAIQPARKALSAKRTIARKLIALTPAKPTTKISARLRKQIVRPWDISFGISIASTKTS